MVSVVRSTELYIKIIVVDFLSLSSLLMCTTGRAIKAKTVITNIEYRFFSHVIEELSQRNSLFNCSFFLVMVAWNLTMVGVVDENSIQYLVFNELKKQEATP